jgi:uncharacterized protein
VGRPVTHWQIVTPHPDRVAAFYAGLFAWEVNADNALGYRRVDTGSEDGVPGGIWPAPPGAPTFVQLIVEVDDVTAHVTRATELGARVLVPPQHLPDGDEMAILQDPEGMSFGLVRSSK